MAKLCNQAPQCEADAKDIQRLIYRLLQEWCISRDRIDSALHVDSRDTAVVLRLSQLA